MKTKKINVRIVGTSPLLIHRYPMPDDKKTTKKNQRKNEDDVESYLYLDKKGQLVQPAEHIVATLRHVASKFQIRGRGKQTYKSIIASGIIVISPELIPHEKSKWEVDQRAVVVQKARIVRSRPRLPEWSLSFQVEYDVDEIDADTLREMLESAGKFSGLGDFRPSTGGSFGRFVVEKFQVEEAR